MGRSRKCNWKRKQLKANKKNEVKRIKEINEIQNRIIKNDNGSFSYLPEDFLRLAKLMPKMHMIKKRRGGTTLVFESKEDKEVYKHVSLNSGSISSGNPIFLNRRYKAELNNEPQKLRGTAPDYTHNFITSDGRFIDPELGDINVEDYKKFWELDNIKLPKLLKKMPIIFGTGGEYGGKSFNDLWINGFEDEERKLFIAGTDSYQEEEKTRMIGLVEQHKIWLEENPAMVYNSKEKLSYEKLKNILKEITSQTRTPKTWLDWFLEMMEYNPDLKKDFDKAMQNYINPIARTSATNIMNNQQVTTNSFNFENVAKICHEANKAYCESIGDFSQPNWDNAPDWQKQSAENGVRFHFLNENTTPADSHNSWLKEKEEQGWKYGEIKNPDLKEHPCFVPYEKLPKTQQLKDYIFKNIVDAYKLAYPIERDLTFGEKAVGVSFNPSKLPEVDKAKSLAAALIDTMEASHNHVTDNGKLGSSWYRNVFRTAAFNAVVAASSAVVKYLTWND